jgi:hypothetical protein
MMIFSALAGRFEARIGAAYSLSTARCLFGLV